MAFQRVIDNKGLNVPEFQYSSFAENVRNETVIIPPTSSVAFGGFTTFDFREKSLLLNDLVLQFQITNPAGGSLGGWTVFNNGGQGTYFPRIMPCWYWFTRIEIVQNNNIIETVYPIENFLHHQCFTSDEERKKLNFGAGNYSTASLLDYNASRDMYTKLFYGEYWYLPLWTYFKSSHIPLLYPKDDLQLRVYMAPLVDIHAKEPASGDFSCVLNCNLVANITRLGQDVNLYRLQSLNRKVEHYKFLELRYSTYAINSGVSSATVVMNAITGNVSYLFAVVRPQSRNSTNINFLSQPFYYMPIQNFSILDSTSTNITGGQPVPFSLLQRFLSRKWTSSSYYADQFAYSGYTTPAIYATQTFEPSSFAIMYSFADNPVEAANSGVSSGAFRFQGNEQLQITFPTALPEAVNIDVYAYVESVVEISPTYVKKINL